MADNVNVAPAGTTPIATDDLGAYGQVQRVKLQAGADGTAVDYQHSATRQDTFTGPGNGTTYGVATQGMEKFSIAVKSTGAVATSWTANAQISLDGTNFTTILIHSNTSPPADDIRVDGQTISTGSNRYPALYFRTNVSALSLGGATNIVVTICGR